MFNNYNFKGNIEATDREIRIKIKKKEPDWWPRLLFDSKDCQDLIINSIGMGGYFTHKNGDGKKSIFVIC